MGPSEARAAQVFLTQHAFVKGIALRHAPFPGLADDIVQQVFVEFLAKAGEWDLTADIRPLLSVMTRTIALRHWREKTRGMPHVMRRLADHVRQLADEQSAEPRYAEELAALRTCLEKLPQKSRSLIDLYYIADVPAR